MNPNVEHCDHSWLGSADGDACARCGEFAPDGEFDPDDRADLLDDGDGLDCCAWCGEELMPEEENLCWDCCPPEDDEGY